MSSTSDLSSRNILLQYAYSFIVSKTMFTACELKLFDLLSQSDGPLSAAAIAERLGTSINGTENLLSACVGLKLLEMNMQNGEACYKNTELSRDYLTTTSPYSLQKAMVYLSTDIYPVSMYLVDAVRQGKCQIEQTFQIPSDKFFKMIYRSEEKIIEFVNYINSHLNFSNLEELLLALDLSSFHSICDLGGCTGALAKKFKSIYSNSSVNVYDLPEIVEAAKKHFRSPEDNISFQQGDFFKDPLPDADLYILARILHNWSDEKCLSLLEKIYMACKPGGGLLILDAVINEDKSGPTLSHMQSILMLLMCEGKERTAAEIEKHLKTVGFTKIKFSIKGNITEAILAIK